MTKFGLSVTIGVLVLIVGMGLFIFGRPSAPVSITEIPVDQTVPTLSVAEFDITFVINVGEKVTFADGLNLQLKEINDSRCKPDAQCIWQGELSAVFTMDVLGSDELGEEFVIGTALKKSLNVREYKFTLESASEKSANVFVSKVDTANIGIDAGIR